MEYLKGCSLRKHMDEKFRKGETFEISRTIKIIILPTCRALAQAHSLGIYHRDLKPDNVIYTEPNRAEIKITDWGLGININKQSMALTGNIGGLGGTPAYCSPEQWFSMGEVDGRTDIFSLGVLFYEMITGKIPLVYESQNTQRRNRPQAPSKINLAISRYLDQCILKMVEFDVANRYQSVWELIIDLESAPDNYS